ncbi:hypothetical protein [Periweissella ghanensis]|uniref:Lipoprotein n=1 Tax=Periweissella ghanensis TaxID=467997 RepID=A0ABN8BJT8_9LACO|nr:hypothetical protein [Periweissella ghanensis]MCM0601170.1 hypothetical protein [Periweissella ghanensis]CAH0417966.1 hypothetical protein WGH24286_00382 [Periweissella ghanensis]
MAKKILFIPILLSTLLILTGCGAPSLHGTYRGHLNLIGTKSTETLAFNGHRVRVLKNGVPAGPTGTYVLTGNKVTVNIDNVHTTFNLVNHQKALVVTDADGIKALAKGTTYHELSK